MYNSTHLIWLQHLTILKELYFVSCTVCCGRKTPNMKVSEVPSFLKSLKNITDLLTRNCDKISNLSLLLRLQKFFFRKLVFLMNLKIGASISVSCVSILIKIQYMQVKLIQSSCNLGFGLSLILRNFVCCSHNYGML